MTDPLFDFDPRELTSDQLRRMNSATQYPSILTYHALGERGRLTGNRTADFAPIDPDDVEVTEKVDGTNARIIVPPGGGEAAFIGSRTELLTYRGDLVPNPAQQIVETIGHVADMAAAVFGDYEDWTVVYGEVYGGKTAAGAKNYTTDPTATGFRVFDIAAIPHAILERQPAEIAAWRDGGGQAFVSTDVLAHAAKDCGFPLVPLLAAAGAPPVSVEDTHQWLSRVIPSSHAALDDTGRGRPEGVIVRTFDRSQIVKVRFEDYERTAKAQR